MSSLVLLDSFSGQFGNDIIVTGIDNTFTHHRVILKQGRTGYNNGVNCFVTKSGAIQSTGTDYRFAGLNQYNGSVRMRNGTGNTQSQVWNNHQENNNRSNGMAIFIADLYGFASGSCYSYFIVRGQSQSNDGYSYNVPIWTAVHTVASASDGFAIRRNSGNSMGGELTLYGVK
tara:strand:- start:5801 stop:6319 length:519 start_codon:yes stop_codon:yes gene_type:complete